MPDSSNQLAEYRRGRIAEWSQPRYEIDRRFVKLTLVLDKGPDSQQRWEPATLPPFDDLGEVLRKTADRPALVVLGAPGRGKSTLLRRLERDVCEAALAGGPDIVTC